MTTTTIIRTIRARISWIDQQVPLPVAIAGSVFVLFALVGALGRLITVPAATAVPTPALPIIMIATPAPVPTVAPIQAAAVLPNTLWRAVVAYDAPGGNVIGAIEQGRAYAVRARWGSDWLQADVADSGLVWLRADQVLDLPADLADLQPPPQPQVVYVAAQPAPAAPTLPPAYETAAALQEPVSGPQAAPVVEPAVRAEDFKEPNRAATCAFIGCLP